MATIIGGSGDETQNGGAAADILYGMGGDDIQYGGGGNDVLYGGDGNDEMYGGDGNDQLTGGAGADDMYGGTGNDTFFVEDAGDQVTELGSEGTDTVVSFLSNYTLGANLEVLIMGGTGNINGKGNELNNGIRGNSGNNSLSGMGGNDSIFGLGGDDNLSGGAGNDLLDGGDGVDEASYKVLATSGVTVDLSITIGQNTGQGIDTLRNIENLSGTEFGDTLSGNAGANKIAGLGGDDTIRGRGGDDDITAGSGADTIVFDAAGAANGVDRIRAFVSGQDKLQFNTADGYDAATVFTAGTAAVGSGAQLVYDDATDNLWYDADGAGGADQILIANLYQTSINAGDICIVGGQPAI